MTSTVVEDESPDQFAVCIVAVLHLHDFNHVQVNGLALFVDAEDGVDNGFGEGVGELGADLCAERGAGNGDENVALHGIGEFKGFEELPRS